MNINEETIDTIKELINIGCGSGAGILNQMVKSHITLHVPSIRIIADRNILDTYLKEYQKYQCVNVNIAGDLHGAISMLLTESTLVVLVKRLTGEDALDDAIDGLKIEVIQEIGNIILNSISGTISNLFRLKINVSLPEFHNDIQSFITKKINEKDYSHYVLVETSMSVDDLNITFYIIILLEADSFQYLIENMDSISLFNFSKAN
ncbi:MAG: chemotaxis protein CheX [Leptospiraceae bacterium]|nr:chemotaxis protein CheX [Leptospiraceae bacterium]